MLRRVVDQQMHTVLFAVHAGKRGFKVRTDLLKDLKDHSEIRDRRTVKDCLAILRDEEQVNMHLEYAMSAVSIVA
jgi:hypothetical protein